MSNTYRIETLSDIYALPSADAMRRWPQQLVRVAEAVVRSCHLGYCGRAGIGRRTSFGSWRASRSVWVQPPPSALLLELGAVSMPTAGGAFKTPGLLRANYHYE